MQCIQFNGNKEGKLKMNGICQLLLFSYID